MKKREKPPEVAAFEQAFDGDASGASSPFSRSQVQPSPFASRLPGQTPGSYPGARAPGSSSGLWSSAPGQSVGRIPGSGRAPGWGEDDEVNLEDEGYYAEDDAPEEAARAERKRLTPPPRAGTDRFSTILVRAALVIVALLAAYSLESHSHRHYFPGVIKGATVNNISYDAGWPLTYALVNEQQVALSAVDPTPAFH